ncbi:hypothetical protein NXX50_09150 [Bacteroides fragilis]|nr:hypothetical protein [Bacteroides fragilis]
MENLSDDKEREQKHSFRPIFKHICWLEAKFPAWRIDRLNCGFFLEIEDRPCGTDSGKTILNRPGRISMTSDKNLFL